MRKPVILTNRMPTVEEIAALSNMSPSRVAWIRRLADKIIAERENGSGRRAATKKSTKTRTATKKKRAAKTGRLKKK
jgi:hypothetical protein